MFQLSAVAHDNRASYYGPNETTGHPADKWGWAVQPSLTIKTSDWTGRPINMQAVYTDGASRYNFQSLFPTTIAMFGGSSAFGAYQSLGFASINDAVFTSADAAAGTVNSGLETVKTWGFRGGYSHNWNPYWVSASLRWLWRVAIRQSCQDNALRHRRRRRHHPERALGLIGRLGGPGVCNPDFNVGVIGVNTVWTPVKGFAFTADVSWTRLDQKYDGTIVVQPPATFMKPLATYELKDQNSVTALLRAQRNF